MLLHRCPPHVQDRKAGSARIGGAGSKGMVDVNPPRGTRDFFPEDKRLQNWLFGEFVEVSRLFGFEQVDFPVLESGGSPLGLAGARGAESVLPKF